jgi:hypothetical protein
VRRALVQCQRYLCEVTGQPATEADLEAAAALAPAAAKQLRALVAEARRLHEQQTPADTAAAAAVAAAAAAAVLVGDPPKRGGGDVLAASAPSVSAPAVARAGLATVPYLFPISLFESLTESSD